MAGFYFLSGVNNHLFTPVPPLPKVRKAMSNTATLRDISVSFEAAYEHVALLENKQVTEKPGVTVYSGDHPEFGAIFIVVPMVGDGLLLLPFAFQQF